jgi:gamma-glutamylcyclotransferase (GGCT)/AIG2-like uncharacterized protein YtfP
MLTGKQLLFEYGQLMRPGGHRVEVKGFLARRGKDDVAAFFSKTTNMTVKGELQVVTPERLAALDKSEKPQYNRVRVRTTGGVTAWAYQCKPSLFHELTPIPSGRFADRHDV